MNIIVNHMYVRKVYFLFWTPEFGCPIFLILILIFCFLKNRMRRTVITFPISKCFWVSAFDIFSIVLFCYFVSFKKLFIKSIVDLSISTHYSPVLLIYTLRKHQETFRFSDVSRGYR